MLCSVVINPSVQHRGLPCVMIKIALQILIFYRLSKYSENKMCVSRHSKPSTLSRAFSFNTYKNVGKLKNKLRDKSLHNFVLITAYSKYSY